jgi:hypothetical protein
VHDVATNTEAAASRPATRDIVILIRFSSAIGWCTGDHTAPVAWPFPQLIVKAQGLSELQACASAISLEEFEKLQYPQLVLSIMYPTLITLYFQESGNGT